MRRPGLLLKAVFLVSLIALLLLPSVASAVLSGANGRIVYISGRGFTDAQAKPYLRVAAGSLGFGLNDGPMSMASGQHRHPTWSPDRTAIAYSLGGDIHVLGLTGQILLSQNITNTPALVEDRPAWSPDGTRIAYESGAAGAQTDILVDPVGEGLTLNLTNSAEYEGKPAWTPDSSEIYYQTGNPALENSLDIKKEPATGGTVTNIAAAPGVNEFQPSLSPDGTQLCFTRGTGVALGAGAASADVIVSLANGGGQNDISDNPGVGDYNCTWSPNGIFVAYVRGTFGAGDLFMERADDTSPFPIELEGAPGVFDGNPDWAPDGRPVCEDVSVSTAFEKPVTVELECFDSGPFYERSFVRESRSQPDNGTVSDVEQGDQGPSTVIYTPNQGFSGTDKFAYNSFDEIAGFGEPKTVTVNVKPPPGPAVDPAPVLSNLTVKPRKWRRGNKPARISAPLGTKVRWRLSEPASTKLTFQRLRKRGGKVRFVNVVSRTIANARAGQNTFSFQGRVRARRKLPLGTYRVSAQARDAAGQASKAVTSNRFTIVAR